jgi:hypothetical protein
MPSVRRTAQRMRIELKKGKDGPSTLACVRRDGTRTWARLHPFFPLHDLTHYAVESVLGFDSAFFGLVASGWAIDDFGQPGASSRLPPEAQWAEAVVGILDRERVAGRICRATEVNELLASIAQGQGVAPFRALTDGELETIRRLRDELHGRWLAVEPGGTLVVLFPATVNSPGHR